MKSLEQIKKSPEFWYPNKRKPQPFPGRYPTRWKIVFTGGMEFVYEGKPNIQAIQRVVRFKGKGTLWFWEYDRGGAFRFGTRHAPIAATFKAIHQDDNLMRFYYPWTNVDKYFCHAWAWGIWMKRITLGKRSWIVYSGHKVMNGGDEAMDKRLRDYRKWVTQSGLLKK